MKHKIRLRLRLRFRLRLFIILSLTPYPLSLFAQKDNLTRAQDCILRGSADSAKMFIIKAMKEPANLNDASAWYVKGFIYKELYKKYDLNTLKTANRDTAINDLFISVRLDPGAENKDRNYDIINWLAAQYYNDAVSPYIMDSLHFHLSIYGFNKFKSIMKKIKPDYDFSKVDINFYDKLGEIYTGYFFDVTKFETKRKYLDSARLAYNEVLNINPNDFLANYGLGRLYYNQAVNILNEVPIDAPIDKVSIAQDTCVHLAKLSLPFMQKAHLLEPLKLEPVRGLEGDDYILGRTDEFKKDQEEEKKIREQQK